MGCGSSKSVEVEDSLLTNSEKPNGVHKLTDDKLSTGEIAITEKPRAKPKFRPGKRVHVKGYVGTVKFVGSTKLGAGEWIGIQLDKKHPRGNNGSYEDTNYFTCKPKHGLFARPEVVYHYSDMDVITEASEISPATIVFIQNRMKRLLSRIRLRGLQQRSGVERKIDAHVTNTPPSETASVNQLSHYLTQPFESEREKAFAIYRWLTFNIEYDCDGFFGRKEKLGTSPEEVLKHRTSVCAGYANLYTALGKAAGLDVHTVAGYSKGYGHKPGQKLTEIDHAWNAVRIEDTWYISDATWGAGEVGKDMLFERNPNTYRFLMVPEDAIYDHLPGDDKWQFLDPLVAKETFERTAVPSGSFFEMGIEMESHKESHYEVSGDSIEMTFYCPGRKMILMGKLKNSAGQTLEGRERVQLRFSGIYQVKMRAQFPEAGNYTLQLFVSTGDKEGLWHLGLCYEITAKKGCGWETGGFPRLTDGIHDNGFQLERPLENIETSDGHAEVILKCVNRRFSHLKGRLQPVNGKQLKLATNQALCFSQEKENEFALKIHAPAPGTYKLDVWACPMEDMTESIFLCSYFVNCTANQVAAVAGYPHLTARHREWGVEVIEPTDNIHSLDGKALIILKAPGNVDNIKGHLQFNKQHMNGYTLTTKQNDTHRVMVQLPDEGIYNLNIFGQTAQENESEFLLSYVIKAAKGAGKNAGFPTLSNAFGTFGLELLDNIENITTSSESVSVTLRNPKEVTVSAFLRDTADKDAATGVCENHNGSVSVTCKVALPGEYKLQLFGKEGDGTKSVFLCTYKILKE